jgi:hypothetical protein
MIQVHVPEMAWRFKSSHPHQQGPKSINWPTGNRTHRDARYSARVDAIIASISPASTRATKMAQDGTRLCDSGATLAASRERRENELREDVEERQKCAGAK